MISTENLSKILLLSVLIFFGLYIGYEIICFLWIDFPFNYYESEVVTDAIAFYHGEPLYPERNEGPWGGLYAPFYHFVLSFFFFILPETIATGRLINILALIFSAYFVYKTIENLPYRSVWAFVAIFLWHESLLLFDMHAKPDSVGTMLAIASVFVLINNEINWKMLALSALFSALSVATKQSMLFVPAGIGLAFLINLRWKEIFTFSVFFLLSSTIIWTIFHFTTGPEMWYYVFIQPGTFRMRWGGLFANIWTINSILPWLILIPFLPKIWTQRNQNFSSLVLLTVSILAIPACVLSATKGGGQSNSFQPFFYLASWMFLFQISQWWKSDLELQKLWNASKSAGYLAISVIILFSWQPNLPSIITSYNFRSSAHINYKQLISDIKKDGRPSFCPTDNYIHIKSGNPVRWSAKWERETIRVNPDNKPYNNSTSIALNHAQVVSINYFSWAKEHALEAKLRDNGYELIKTYPMDQFREYRLWRRP